MKLVINKCHGGFGLSLLAIQRYCELIGKEAHFYRAGERDGLAKKVDVNDRGLFVFCVHNDYGDTVDINAIPDDAFFDKNAIPRNDPILVQVVEELGVKANRSSSELKIVEIPDDVEWQIEEYDGLEWVAEKHRTWR